jgi:hypothetical protein
MTRKRIPTNTTFIDTDLVQEDYGNVMFLSVPRKEPLFKLATFKSLRK